MMICMALVASTGTQASDWTHDDTGRELVFQGLLLVDWGQTLDISYSCHNGGKYYETNPILGECPDRGKVNTYILGAAVLHAGISYVLPPDWRKPWQYTSIIIEAGAVAHNINIGLQVRF
jgi:hypothetical protein